jgi:hypothetical protein
MPKQKVKSAPKKSSKKSEQESNSTAIVKFSPYSIMDALDEKAIMAEIEGRILGTWVYSFPQGGITIWGLAKNGVDQCCIELEGRGNAIREVSLDYKIDEQDKDYMLFTAIAERIVIDKNGVERKLAQAVGTKRQCKKMKLRDGSSVSDPFWFEKGSIKALRNARSRLIPENIKSIVIAQAKRLKRTVGVSNPAYKSIEPASDPQKKLIWALGKQLECYDLADDSKKQLTDFKKFLEKNLKLKVAHFSKLTKGGASRIIDGLQGLLEKAGEVKTIKVEK